MNTEIALCGLVSGLLLLAAATPAAHAASVTFGTGGNQFDIDFVEIGDPGNAADTTGTPSPVGSVANTFYMSTNEVSRDMVSKATMEGSLGITMAEMTSYGGNGADRPGTGVSWYEAATFVNWLNTSQGFNAAYKFDTVGGTFSLWTGSDAGYDASNPYRNTLANYYLPSVDEWYKAAYYDPGSDTYFDFATGQHAGDAPTAVAGGTTAGTAVYGQATAAGPADITNAGGLSPFGTMGQSGNVWEWQETAYDLTNDSTSENRGLRGGAWINVESNLRSSIRSGNIPTFESASVGFRVAGASVVPEPSRALLGAVGLCGVLLRRRSR